MPKKKGFSPWSKLGVGSATPTVAASPWAGMRDVKGATELAESMGYATRVPAPPRDMTLTGDMAASSPVQQAAAEQFAQHMRAAEAARGPDAQTEQGLAEYDEKLRIENEQNKLMEEIRRRSGAP